VVLDELRHLLRDGSGGWRRQRCEEEKGAYDFNPAYRRAAHSDDLQRGKGGSSQPQRYTSTDGYLETLSQLE
jgi:hypothetical protein